MTFGSGKCAACGKDSVPRAKYCARCERHVGDHERAARAKALKAAYDASCDGFICAYTGEKLEGKDSRVPWYVCFDHDVPGKKGGLVVVARFVNNMKSQLSGQEFRAVITELARCIKEGGVFDRNVAAFEYWTGPVVPAKKAVDGRNDPTIDLTLPKESDCVICGRRTVPYSKYCRRCRRLVREGNITDRKSVV
jgi:hypothetical protein